MVQKMTLKKVFHTNLLLHQEKGSVHARYLVENRHTFQCGWEDITCIPNVDNNFEMILNIENLILMLTIMLTT